MGHDRYTRMGIDSGVVPKRPVPKRIMGQLKAMLDSADFKNEEKMKILKMKKGDVKNGLTLQWSMLFR